RRLRKITRQLGAVREFDALLAIIQELDDDPRCSPAALNQVRESLEEARAAAAERLVEKLPHAKIHRLARRLDEVARQAKRNGQRQRGKRRPKRTWAWVVDARATRRAAALRASVEAAGAVYASERLHSVRIALKKLRYTMELAGEAHGGRGRDVA